ncbi:hypothetical protein HN51_043836 [Arachis hypogaea]|uniref:non-specific serine/threonine protein kinase n=1 Tax=Arachis hypogaea TaxID=3818 RepID=A0A444Y562_ARAHY|nr:putative receptor-like protein kinase At4g00960 isoform X1 [Arachis ipaensis]XP_025670971.1 putative receptor-like protein kinase At4g00960 isoform X1 [Arachis hypogaea]QHN95899.1 G-type lectin S-receptor-like serine/threonine-protein kinase [Arachis hypogaea]RYQ97039.1 hypothetical protein Ahy_B08g093015 isoform A [Arachis hypogaea]
MMEVVLSLMLISSAHFLLTEESQNDSVSSSSGGNESYCDFPGICGPNGNCDVNKPLACGCLDGFTPKSPTAFDSLDYTHGCVRKKPLNCSTDVFVAYAVFQEPTGTSYYHSFFNQSSEAEGCKEKCKSNCSCMAAYTEIGSGECKLWSGDLFDVRVIQEGRQYLYIRMPALDHAEPGGRSHRRSDHKVVGVVVGSAAVVILGMILASWYMLSKRTDPQALGDVRIGEMLSHANEQEGDLELPLLDLSRIAMATDNFSLNNKLGEGGFGPVYKGVLDDGQQIAVKRLSSSSGQGLNEFKTEVKLIAKLRHRNLVKLLGCCIHEEEKLLVYEYMPNRSLDYFIFDQMRKKTLDWPKRFNIICGIARGLLYLHQDSRLRIIHRDLKVSNVLLDSKMNPKISDFGLARSFGGDQSKGNTHRVVGTVGYMAPEYAVHGNFSVKSDVFSFGILLLEIISGRKNRRFYYPSSNANLYGHAWDLWKQGRSLELVDEWLKETWNVSEVQRCIHISLLCAQQHPQDRPTMSSVVLMLGTEIDLPQPKYPTFFVAESSEGTSSSSCKNELSVTELEPR